MKHVVVDASPSRSTDNTQGNSQLAQAVQIKLLICLLARSKEITAAILKEFTSGYAYEDDYTKQLYICAVYCNIKIVMARVLELCVVQHRTDDEMGTTLKLCRVRLCSSLGDIGMFLYKNHTQRHDLKHFRAEQVLALLINVVYTLQTYILCGTMAHSRNQLAPHTAICTETTRILEIINLAVNRLDPKSPNTSLNMADISRLAAMLNILNRIVISTERLFLYHSERSTMKDLVSTIAFRLQVLLFKVQHASENDHFNKILCKVANAALEYYVITVNSAFKSHVARIQPLERSLAFSLVRSLALAAEIRTLSLRDENYSTEEKRDVCTHYTKKIFNSAYASIIAYSRQLTLQERYPLSAECLNYNACLDCIERTSQKTITLRSKVDASNTMDRHLQMLEESFVESIELCSHVLQKKDSQAQLGNAPTCRLSQKIDELVVMDPFYPSRIGRPSALLDSIDEEMCLLGRGGGEWKVYFLCNNLKGNVSQYNYKCLHSLGHLASNETSTCLLLPAIKHHHAT